MLRCDFCGKESKLVKRVVLDTGYDRLTIRHEKKYACPDCSIKKDSERRGISVQSLGFISRKK